MKPDISEFSFGYAVVETIVKSLPDGVKGAPLFPTQASEGKVGGYDVELKRTGGPLFLQFKRAHVMTRKRATGSEDFPGDFYRMHLYSRDGYRQHRLLCDWENKGNEVYYCAPRLSRPDELDEAYLGGKVLESSIFFSPSSIPLDQLGGGEHTLSYDATSDFGVLRSTPMRVSASAFDLRAVVHHATSGESLKANLREALHTLRVWAHGSAPPLAPERDHPPDESADDLLREVARLCKIVAGCECLLLWRQE